MPERKYIDIPMPSDPNVPLTPEQLSALFPNRRAGEAFCKLIAHLAAARLAAVAAHTSADEHKGK
jgi:hypothetical protein